MLYYHYFSRLNIYPFRIVLNALTTLSNLYFRLRLFLFVSEIIIGFGPIAVCHVLYGYQGDIKNQLTHFLFMLCHSINLLC